MLTDTGVPVLSRIAALMDHCEVCHTKWLDYATENLDCWESRYRDLRQTDDLFKKRVRQSLKYRFASVGLCISQSVADEILNEFEPTVASRILLHLHIVFDHVLCHGFGSEFGIDMDSSSGTDLRLSRTSIFRELEHEICSALAVPFPRIMHQEFAALCEDEHFLCGIRLDMLTEETLPDIRNRIHEQVNKFHKQVERLEKKENLIRKSITVSAILVSSLYGTEGVAATAAVLAAGGLNDRVDIPETISKEVVKQARALHTRNLGCYLTGTWE